MSEQRAIMGASPFSQEKGSAPVDGRRAALFRETPWEYGQRIALGLAWPLRPERIGALVPLARAWFADLGRRGDVLPEADALGEGVELVGIARDLSVPTLLAAYRRGLFPRSHVGVPKWWSPLERGVVRLDAFHISTRLRSMMRQGRYAISFDRDFEGVIKECAGRRAGRLHLTWITPHIMHAYARAFDAGHVHSFEVWNQDGELAGGGYGVAVGRVFVIESQFFRESNASKIGFSVLAWHLAQWGFVLADNKWLTPTTAQMGFYEMPRREYLRRLAALAQEPVQTGRWEVEADTKTVADWRPLAETD